MSCWNCTFGRVPKRRRGQAPWRYYDELEERREKREEIKRRTANDLEEIAKRRRELEDQVVNHLQRIKEAEYRWDVTAGSRHGHGLQRIRFELDLYSAYKRAATAKGIFFCADSTDNTMSERIESLRTLRQEYYHVVLLNYKMLFHTAFASWHLVSLTQRMEEARRFLFAAAQHVLCGTLLPMVFFLEWLLRSHMKTYHVEEEIEETTDGLPQAKSADWRGPMLRVPWDADGVASGRDAPEAFGFPETRQRRSSV